MIDALTTDTLLETAGRLHPLVLHLPIGLLLLLVVVEIGRVLQRGERRVERPALVWIAVWLAALGAAGAAASGWQLGASPDYAEGGALTLHRWLGVGVAVAAAVTAVAWTVRWTRGYQVFLVLAAGLLVPAGHYGGTMTHGPGFVTEPIRLAMAEGRAPAGEPAVTPDVTPDADLPAEPQPEEPIVLAAADEPVVALGSLDFATDVLPILDARCASCHGDRRQRGQLALLSSTDILRGGDGGPVVPTAPPASPAAARETELLRRILLPLEDDLHMPPDGRRQPTAEEIALLTTWIEAGAPFDVPFGPPSASEPAPPVVAVAPATAPAPEPEPEAEPAPPVIATPTGPRAADPAALAAIRDRFATAAALVPGQPGVRVDLGVAPTPLTPEEMRSLLSPLTLSLVELSLARTAVDDTLAPTLVRMRHLESLDLRDTNASDTLAASLVGLPRLRELVLVGTPVGDPGIDAIARGLPALERLHVWRTGASPEAIARLRAARPGLAVLGDPLADAEPLETEPPIALSGSRPLPGATDPGPGDAPASATTTADLTPVNATCPVTGATPDPRFTIVHDGRVVAFCCGDCVQRFWAEPARYPITAD